MDKERGSIRIYIIILLVSSFSFFAMSSLPILSRTLVKFQLIGDDNVFVSVDSNYVDYGYTSTILGKQYNHVKTISDVDTSKIGKYEITYIMNFLLYKRELKRTVNVIDNVAPTIELVGDEQIYLELGNNYEEPGYLAIDNVDGDITENVKVDNNIDTNAPGSYSIKYSIRDSSDNVFGVVRNVEVRAVNPLTLSIPDYNLNYYFQDVTLKYEEQEYDFMKDTVMLGDSNTTYLYFHGKYMPAGQIWGKNGLNVSQINNSTFKMFNTGQLYTFDQAMAIKRPKYLILNVGITCVEFFTADKMKSELKIFIDKMRNEYSDVKLIISALLPIHQGSYNASTQKKINDFNYYIGEICEEYRIPFINFAQEVKAKDGLADRNLFECYEQINCGFHLNETGKRKYVDYLKHLNFEKEM